MNTFPLSPEPAVAPNTTAASGTPSTQEASGEEFSPALDNAITDLNQETQTTASNSETCDTTPINEVKGELSSESSLAASLSTADLSTLNLTPENISPMEINVSTNALPDKTVLLPQTPSSAILSASKNETPVFLSDVTTSLSEGGTATKTPEKAETILLQQIQQILDEGKDKGTIIIKASTEGTASAKVNGAPLNALSSPVLADATENATIQARQNIAQVVMPEERSKTLSSPSSRSESIRQDVTEQFLNAKLSRSDKDKNASSQQHHEQKGNNGQNKNAFQQTISINSTNINTDSSTPETSFGQQLGSSSTIATSTTTTSPISVEGKFAPGANIPVAEQEIINTLIQKFNVNPRLQTSKLTMQLHPVELGSLKIDIVVKEGSISAHIVAQSQQALDTLDKNASRLREVLQDQGFQVEDFKITLDADRGSEQQLFQEQFESKQQDFIANESITSPETETFDALLQEQEEVEDSNNTLNSVNLTA